MKKTALQKYFSPKRVPIIEPICIAVIVLAAVAMIALPGGIPLGLPPAVIAAIILIFVNTAKTKDTEIDAVVDAMIQARPTTLDLHNSIGVYDLAVAPVVKGKDGKLRTSRYVLTLFAPDSDGWTVTVYRFDLLTEETTREVYHLPADVRPLLQESHVMTPVGRKSRYALTSSLFSADIPVSMADIDSARFLEDFCRSM